MKRASILATAVTFWGSITLGSPVWTETFDNGVGRLNITSGQGDTAFLHDPVAEDLDATFVRRDIAETTTPDRRLASLGRTYSNADIVSFSVEWTPVSASGNAAWPLIGFFDSNSLKDIAVFRIRNLDSTRNYRISINWDIAPAVVIDPSFPNWQWGETYLLQLTMDGPNQEISFSTSIFQDGEFQLQGSQTEPLPPTLSYALDTLGIGNIIDDQYIDSSLTSRLDNFAFTPEPSTALLLGVASLVVMRRRRAP
jgi:hypothetical protein